MPRANPIESYHYVFDVNMLYGTSHEFLLISGKMSLILQFFRVGFPRSVSNLAPSSARLSGENWRSKRDVIIRHDQEVDSMVEPPVLGAITQHRGVSRSRFR